jgi:hypothetical protein
MKLRIRASLVMCTVVLAVLPTPRARASEFDKKTTVTFSGPVEIPGRVLPAGTYVFKRLDPDYPDIVEILSGNETHVEATLLGIPASRRDATDETVIELREPSAEGAPPAIREWFYPGDIDGVAFVYPKKHAAALAQATQTQAPETSSDVANDGAKSEPVSQPVETPAAPAPVVAETEKAPASTVHANGNDGEAGEVVIEEGSIEVLPKTASNLPLLGLAGSILTLSAIPLGLVARKRS